MRQFRFLIGSLAFTLLLGLAGCAATPETRIRDNPDAYASLTPEQRAQVSQGEISLGMPEAGVRLALGEPDEVTERTDGKGTVRIWHYRDPASQTQTVTYSRLFYSPAYYGFFPEIVVLHPGPGYDRMRVGFDQGKVISIERAVKKP